ncbi:methyl-accepting chemotaxis protein [Idiomarina sp.]|uniref:methyl-accepting chemotaxis protein n=1 Tax=Idiomarina sp. TaxID=1874361 RepID=UPI0025870882|nr:methyl-accepting chemotaxis protein [Idiomarina sp.]
MNRSFSWGADTLFVFSLNEYQQVSHCPENIQGLMKKDKDELLKKPLTELIDSNALPDKVIKEVNTSLKREVPWRGIVPFNVPERGTVWFDVIVRGIFRRGKVTGSQWLMHQADSEHASAAKNVYRKRTHWFQWLTRPFRNWKNTRRWAKALADADGSTAKTQHEIFGSSSPMGRAMYELALRDSSLLALTARLSEGNDVLAESVNSTAENASKTADATEQTVQDIEQIATSMEQMGQTVDEIARNANDSSSACSDVSKQTQNAADFIADSSKKITKLVSVVSESARQTEELSRNADSVKEVSEKIDAIAEQTNLLALNAAIESARAGEHGRGFSVVADEVRALSQKTQQAVDQIEETVNRMTQSMSTWRNKMFEQRDLAEECGELGRKSEQQVYEVTEAVTGINDRMTQIAVAAEEHTSAVSEVKDSMISINDNVRSANKLTRDTEGEVKAIKTRLREFRSLVEAFEDD